MKPKLTKIKCDRANCSKRIPFGAVFKLREKRYCSSSCFKISKYNYTSEQNQLNKYGKVLTKVEYRQMWLEKMREGTKNGNN